MFLIYFLLLLHPIIADENIPIVQLLAPKNFNPNQIVRLNCNLLSGQSPFNFEWYFKDQKLVNNNKTTIKIGDDSADLIIRQLSVEDLGDYKCIVSNSYGKDEQKVSLFTNCKLILMKTKH